MPQHRPTGDTWQPIGLATPMTSSDDPRAFIHDLSVARAKRTARSLVAPGIILAATLSIAGQAAAHNGVVHTDSGDVPVDTWVAEHPGEPVPGETPTTVASPTDADLAATSGMSTTSTETETTSGSTGPTAGLPTGGLADTELPGADLPVVGSFVANSPRIFSGGLLGGGETTKTSAPRPEHTEGEHTEGGDACDFFLEHMWKNEDGIPVIGTNTHFLTYHTDAEYYNLILSLASGSIGNSQMPIIDIYGGPLGWIPVFNPEHVEGHGTDYATMLTGCGGMGLPIDTKTGEVNLERLPTPEKVMTFAESVMPSVPDPGKIMGPDYLYNTLAVDEITNRLGWDTVFTPDEYLNFATNNFDAFRLLWQTALEKFASGDPAAVLEILQVTDNIKTLESLGLPGFSSLLGGVVPQADGTKTVTIDGEEYPVENGNVTVDGTTYHVTDDKVTIDGTTYEAESAAPQESPVSSLPTGDLPGGDALTTLPIIGSLLGGSTPAPAPTDGGSEPTDGTDGGSTPTDGTDGADGTDGTDGGSDPGSATGSLPTGDLTSGIPILGGLLGGSTPAPAPTDGGSEPTDGTDGTNGGTTPTDGTDPAPAPGGDPLDTLPTGDLLGSLPVLGGGGSAPAPGNGGTEPTDGSDPAPAPGGDPLDTLPTGDLLGSLPVLGGGGSAPAPGNGGTEPTDGSGGGTEPAPAPAGDLLSSLPTGDLLGGDLLGSMPVLNGGATAPAPTGGGTEPSTSPTGTTTPTGGADTPPAAEDGTVAFNVGTATVNGSPSGAVIPSGGTVTYRIPVTNTGDLPLTSLSGTASDGGVLQAPSTPVQPGQTATMTYTTTAKPGTQSVTFNIVGANANGEQMARTCSATYTGTEAPSGEVASTGMVKVGSAQPVSASNRYVFSSTDVTPVSFQVTNSGDAPITLSATSPSGQVTCAQTTLQPGASTYCTVPVSPKSGVNTVTVNFTGVDSSGRTTTAQESFEYTLCTCGASTPSGPAA